MQSFTLTKADGWVQVSSGAACRLQVLSGWYPGMLQVHIGPTAPDDTSPYFEVVQGEYFIKSTGTDNVYVHAVSANSHGTDYPINLTVSDEAIGSTGGSSSGGLTNAELRATPVPTVDAATASKIEELRVQLTTLLGNTDSLESLSTNTNALLTSIQGYIDQLESLTSTVGTNTTNLSTLLTQLGLNTDQVETIMQSVVDRLPASVGKKVADSSLSVTLASDEGLLGAIQGLTKPSDNQFVISQPSIYTPTFTRVTVAGTVSDSTPAEQVSIANVGGANGTILGTSVKPGEVIEFIAPSNGQLAAIVYDATGTEFVIVTMTRSV